MGKTIALKCFQCGGLSGLPCAEFDTDKIQFQKVCNDTVQSCITSYANGSKFFEKKIRYIYLTKTVFITAGTADYFMANDGKYHI